MGLGRRCRKPPTLIVGSAQSAASPPCSTRSGVRSLHCSVRAVCYFIPVDARDPQEIETAFAAFAKEGVQAFIVAGDAVFFDGRREIADLALRNRLPSMFSQREYTEAGGLMSYGENLSDFFRRAASFVGKIFKGASPGDLPIEQPTRFNLVINRQTADALGLTIPPQLYIFADDIFADEVIE
jgi:putative tryptophan/tyrosine transport system substrate-binding protein